MKRPFILLAAVLSTGLQAAPADDHALTIYSRAQPGAVDPGLYRPGDQSQGDTVPGYAVVRQDHAAELEAGTSELRVRDVAALIDPTTVSIRAQDGGGGLRVLEQNFEFDLVSSAKLLNRYLDRRITVTRASGDEETEISGTLLSTDGGLVLRRPDGGIRIITRYRDVQLPELPNGLITRPTLVWRVASDTAGPRQLRISYQTGGLTWWADYNAVLDETNGCRLDLSAWVSIVNQSGAGYPDARLKLIAGDVQRASRPEPRVMMEMARSQKAAEPGFQEKSFFEYHLYTLPRRTSLPDNSTKQLELFPTARGVPCDKEYVYDPRGAYPGYQSSPMLERDPGRFAADDVSVLLAFRNDEASGLGMPLPAGRLRVNKLDTADDSLEFIGEDVIEHTPKDEDLRVKMGHAFDIVAERTQTDFRVDTGAGTLSESFEIQLRNHKDVPVTVKVNQALYRWVNWKIVDSSHDFDKLDARSIQFPVSVDADGETTVRYQVNYSW